MNGSFIVEFGAPGDPGITRIDVSAVHEFEAVVDLVDILARDRGTAFLVDLRPVWPRNGDPVLVQFLLGDAERGGVLWHDDGVTFAAVDARLRQLDHDIEFARVHSVETADPELTRIAPHTAADAVSVYLMPDVLPASVQWPELPDD